MDYQPPKKFEYTTWKDHLSLPIMLAILFSLVLFLKYLTEYSEARNYSSYQNCQEVYQSCLKSNKCEKEYNLCLDRINK